MRADFHIHSKYSGDPLCIQTPKEIIKRALKVNLDAVAITDHNSIKGSIEGLEVWKKEFKNKIDYITGEEVRTSHGDVLALFVQELIPPKLSPEETIDRIHEQGGLAIAAHPFFMLAKSLGKKTYELKKLDGIEVMNALCWGPLDFSRKARQAVKKMNVAETGSSDAHFQRAIGVAYTNYQNDLFKDIKKRLTKAERHASLKEKKLIMIHAGIIKAVDFIIDLKT